MVGYPPKKRSPTRLGKTETGRDMGRHPQAGRQRQRQIKVDFSKSHLYELTSLPSPPHPWRGDHERGTEAYAWGTDGWMDVGCMKQKGKKEKENENKK